MTHEGAWRRYHKKIMVIDCAMRYNPRLMKATSDSDFACELNYKPRWGKLIKKLLKILFRRKYQIFIPRHDWLFCSRYSDFWQNVPSVKPPVLSSLVLAYSRDLSDEVECYSAFCRHDAHVNHIALTAKHLHTICKKQTNIILIKQKPSNKKQVSMLNCLSNIILTIHCLHLGSRWNISLYSHREKSN